EDVRLDRLELAPERADRLPVGLRLLVRLPLHGGHARVDEEREAAAADLGDVRAVVALVERALRGEVGADEAGVADERGRHPSRAAPSCSTSSAARRHVARL